MKKFTALSLAEVMIVLVITSVTLVIISRLTASLIVSIKNDEIEDFATGIAVQTLELSKSPDDLALQTILPTQNPTGEYVIDLNSQPARLVQVSAATPTNIREISDCEEDSIYRIDFELSSVSANDLTPVPLICMQVILRQQQDSLDTPQYLLRSVTVSRLGNEVRVNTIEGFRRGNFEISDSFRN